MIINQGKTIRAVIDRFGHKHQSVIAIEEMAELTKELTKAIRGKPNHDHLVEETADVIICLIQVREMYNIKDEELQDAINSKLARLDERLKNE